jgi:hypothetical protein
MHTPTDETCKTLGQLFDDSPFVGGEDWDLIFADSNRVSEFCDFYENKSLNADEKIALMELIVASYDDYLSEAKDLKDSLEERISNLLEQDFELHKNTIIYWSALQSHDPNSLWSVSPIMRNVLLKYNGEA